MSRSWIVIAALACLVPWLHGCCDLDTEQEAFDAGWAECAARGMVPGRMHMWIDEDGCMQVTVDCVEMSDVPEFPQDQGPFGW